MDWGYLRDQLPRERHAGNTTEDDWRDPHHLRQRAAKRDDWFQGTSILDRKTILGSGNSAEVKVGSDHVLWDTASRAEGGSKDRRKTSSREIRQAAQEEASASEEAGSGLTLAEGSTGRFQEDDAQENPAGYLQDKVGNHNRCKSTGSGRHSLGTAGRCGFSLCGDGRLRDKSHRGGGNFVGHRPQGGQWTSSIGMPGGIPSDQDVRLPVPKAQSADQVRQHSGTGNGCKTRQFHTNHQLVGCRDRAAPGEASGHWIDSAPNPR